jgi:membrane protease YdiL (CAAX protease family)
MKEVIKRHLVANFYIITFIFSGMMVLLNIFVFKDAQKYAVSFPQLAPGIVAVVFIGLLNGREEIGNLLRRFTVSGIDARWISLSIIVPIIITGMSYCILSIVNLGGIMSPTLKSFTGYLIYIPGIVIGSIGEEAGWRGFMLPKLLLRYKPLTSAVLLGTLWGIWHLNFEFGMLGFILYSITVVELSILFTWLYSKSNGNLLIAVTFHSILNLVTRVLLYSQIGIALFIVEIIVYAVACVIIIGISGINNLPRRQEPNSIN